VQFRESFEKENLISIKHACTFRLEYLTGKIKIKNKRQSK